MIKIGRHLSHLVLKPTLACTANCATCSTRKDLHRSKIRDETFDVAFWKELLAEVDELGVSKLTFSGGEPTLYKYLLELVAEGKKHGFEVGLNTNGSRIDDGFSRELVAAGLDAVSISLYSSTAEIHDAIRQSKGLWKKATQAARHFAGIRGENSPELRLGMQTIICRDNYEDFARLVELAYELEFCSLTFSYLEADYQNKQFLLSAENIRDFKRDIVPKAVRVIQEKASDRWIERLAVSAVESIYDQGRVTTDDYAKGVYRRPRPCLKPSYFCIVLANGDVHPCNMVEYTHFPVVGNLRRKGFREIWEGDAWNEFRKNGFYLCRYCPVPHQVAIPVVRRPEYALVQHFLNNTGLRSAVPSLKRIAFSNKHLLKFLRG